MLRVVLAVVLGAALLSVSLAALGTASHDAANARLAADAERVTAAAADLRERAAPVASGDPGARRVVTVRVPAESWWSARVRYLAVGGSPDGGRSGTAVAWRVAGSSRRTRTVRGVGVVGADGDDATPGRLVLREPGRHRLALDLVSRDGRRTVVVRPLD